MQIEYTDENKSFVVVAGVKVFNFITGSEGKITDIKDESIIMLNGKVAEGSKKILSLVDGCLTNY